MTSPTTPRGPLTADQGRVLLAVARRSIAEHLGLPSDPAQATELEGRLAEPVFQTPRASFVTLTIEGSLRGCIGSLAATEPLADNVRRNAVCAAFGDPRFPPLTAREFPRVAIEVSLLTEPQPLPHGGGEDLLSRLRPGVDGVVIRRGAASATFLPQVWEQLPAPRRFLEHLCLKAGLPSTAWREPGLEVATYQVQCFREEH